MSGTLTTGLTIAFSSGFLAEITGFGHAGMERASIEDSHFGTTTWRTFLAGLLVDPGELEVELNFIPGTTPPHASAPETITITYPDAGAATWVASGFMTNFQIQGAAPDEKLIATATLKLSGALVVTP